MTPDIYDIIPHVKSRLKDQDRKLKIAGGHSEERTRMLLDSVENIFTVIQRDGKCSKSRKAGKVSVTRNQLEAQGETVHH